MAGKRKSRVSSTSAKKPNKSKPEPVPVNGNKHDDEGEARFLGDSVPYDEAKKLWPQRYSDELKKRASKPKKDDDDDSEEVTTPAKCHYLKAEVDGFVYELYDNAHVKAGEGEDPYICKIVEFFEDVEGNPCFTAQWFYRAKDTVIKNSYPIEEKHVFFSEVKNDNPLECLLQKLKIAKVSLNVNLEAKNASIPSCDYYVDMLYLLPYSTFINLPAEYRSPNNTNASASSSDVDSSETKSECDIDSQPELSLLDLYAGCGAMSTGLCLGANMAGENLVTKWAVDMNKYACESLKLNHPETQVRNELAEDFLSLLKEWEKLCVKFKLIRNSDLEKQLLYNFDVEDEDENESEEVDEEETDDVEIFEVERVLDICFGDPKESGDRGLYLKVRWKRYGPEHDSWEPIDGLGNCGESIRDFVTEGHKSRILPLPGQVDVICGGPPCQGISGFNRFRNTENPLEDEKNRQLIVYMEIVDYLKPRFILMENVVDILKFKGGFLGRYALGRLIEMNYQCRIGMVAAGAYGLPQFRMRFFLWGACPTERLPQYPLPTHDVIVRGVAPLEFERNIVAYDEDSKVPLEKELFLMDALSDLPAIENNEWRDEMPYDQDPQTEFQRFIRLKESSNSDLQTALYDHRPLELNNDDYQRVCRIPKKKGANFRDLPGVRVRHDNRVEWDPDVQRVYLDSGKPLVPDYAMSFVKGASSKPFARLWWDETVPTVVTRAEPHNQAILHPEQDRVLSIRENARLQGFPDHYKLCGPIKERYIQVGNAVAVSVSRALGYSLGLAFQKSISTEPVFTLPKKFPYEPENFVAPIESDGATA